MGFLSQVSPSTEPQIETSSDSCSIWSVMTSVHRNVRVRLPLMSTFSPSPFATTRVPGGIRANSIPMASAPTGPFLAQGILTQGLQALPPAAQLRQALSGGRQRLFRLAKGEADLLAPIPRAVIEA